MRKLYFSSDYHKSLYDIFLTYANFPFYSDQRNVWKFYEAIKKFDKQQTELVLDSEYFHIVNGSIATLDFNNICKHLVKESAKYKDQALSDYHRFKKQLSSGGFNPFSEFFPPDCYKIAFSAAWGFCSDYTCKTCKYNEIDQRYETARAQYKKDYRTVGRRIKCYECDQAAFIYILNQLIDQGDEAFSNGTMDDIIDTLIESRNLYSKSVVCAEKTWKNGVLNTSTGNFKEITIFDPSQHFSRFRFHGSSPAYLFSTFIFSILGFSFLSFLKELGADNLKKCPYCGDFFISKDVKRKKRCYKKDCEKAYRRDAKRIYRIINPATHAS